MKKKDSEKAVFDANREIVLKLQDLEQYLERELEQVRADKNKHLAKLKNVCSHSRILEMMDINPVLLSPFVADLLRTMQHDRYIPCVRICQICGLMDLRLKKGDTFFYNFFPDSRIRRDNIKLERPNHSHWTVGEYVNLRPL